MKIADLNVLGKNNIKKKENRDKYDNCATNNRSILVTVQNDNNITIFSINQNPRCLKYLTA